MRRWSPDCLKVGRWVAKAADGYAAVGCGDQIALGAAERFSAGVRGPFVCLKG